MEQLLEVLRQIERPGSFCTSGTINPSFSGLEIVGDGSDSKMSLLLPLSLVDNQKNMEHHWKSNLD